MQTGVERQKALRGTTCVCINLVYRMYTPHAGTCRIPKTWYVKTKYQEYCISWYLILQNFVKMHCCTTLYAAKRNYQLHWSFKGDFSVEYHTLLLKKSFLLVENSRVVKQLVYWRCSSRNRSLITWKKHRYIAFPHLWAVYRSISYMFDKHVYRPFLIDKVVFVQVRVQVFSFMGVAAILFAHAILFHFWFFSPFCTSVYLKSIYILQNTVHPAIYTMISRCLPWNLLLFTQIGWNIAELLETA